MKKDVFAILMAGGKGTRLWPLSTADHSKSFVNIGKRPPLIVDTVARVSGLVGRRNIITVVDKAQERVLKKVVKGLPEENILVEPFGRSTASAVGYATTVLKEDDIMVVLPTDHVIKNPAKFRKTLRSAVNFARDNEGALVCIGIRPRHASTAYGYIKVGSNVAGRIYSVEKFIEKPNEAVARKLIRSPYYLWNGGMFVFKVKSILGAMKKVAPLLYRNVGLLKSGKKSVRAIYGRMKNISIDFQIMEKVSRIYCIKADFPWSDLGSWASMGDLFDKNKEGNIVFGRSKLIDTRGSVIYNSAGGELGVVGLRDAVVVRTEKGTLVCSKNDAEKVKELS